MLFAILLIVFSIYKWDLVIQFYENVLTIKAVYLSIISIIVLLVAVFLIRKYDLINKLLLYYQVNLNGLLIFEAGYNNNQLGMDDLKEKFMSFQSKYEFLNFNIDFSSKKVKVEIQTPKTILIKNGEKMLNRLVEELNSILLSVPTGKLLININIKGVIKNLYKTINFVIVNNNEKVGLRKNIKKNKLLNIYTID